MICPNCFKYTLKKNEDSWWLKIYILQDCATSIRISYMNIEKVSNNKWIVYLVRTVSILAMMVSLALLLASVYGYT